MFGLGIQELIVILVVALLVIGPKKLPEIAKVLGKALREFKSATDDIKQQITIDPVDYETRTAIKSAHSPKQPTKPEKENNQAEPPAKDKAD